MTVLEQNIHTALQKFPKRAQVTRIRVFGSRARGDARRDSDLDLLVDVKRPFSLLDLVALQRLLEEACGTPVDLLTSGGIHPVLRSQILASAMTIYEK